MIAKAVRRTAEQLSRNRVLKRRLPGRFGGTPLFVSPDSQLKYLKLGENAFDKDLLRVAEEHVNERSSVWDIGANVGVFSFAAAALAKNGRVIAIEPDVWLAHLIQRSSDLPRNRSLKISVLCSAVSASVGIARFQIASRGRASNALSEVGGRSEAGGARREALVPTTTLDTLLEEFGPPDFVKVDVEGAELLVLAGATVLLGDVKPKILIEVGSDNATEITRILKEQDYELFDGGLPFSEASPVDQCVFNTLAIPKSSIVP